MYHLQRNEMYRLGDNAQKSYVVHRRLTIQKGAKNTINITNQRFLDNYILIPTDSNDLQQISNLLLRLNAKKDLMQNMLQQYQEQKQYLLRQMFI